MNRFNGLGLVDRMLEELWTEVHNIVKEAVTKTITKKKKCKKSRHTGVTGKFGLGVQNEAGQRLTVLPREHTGHSKHPLLI